MANKVSPPKSLKVTRSKNKYTFSWTRGEKYSKDQNLAYKIDRIGKKKDKWTEVKDSKITKNTTKYAISSKLKNIDKIIFKVQGVSGKKKSKWVDYSFNISKPATPRVDVEVIADNTTKFNYAVAEKEKTPVYWMEWQSILSRDGNAPPLDKNWKTYASKSNYSNYLSGNNVGKSKTKYVYKNTGSWQKAENFTTGWVRHFKVRAVGAGGYSPWGQNKHVYNQPNAAQNVTYSNVSVNASRIQMTVSWDTNTSTAKPVTKSVVQYYIGTLGNNYAPTGGQWQDAIGGTVKDYPSNGNTQSASIQINDVVSVDQFLWIRVTNYYESFQIGSEIVPVMGTAVNTKLAKPSNIEVEYDSDTHIASIKATNNSQAVNSFLVVRYYDNDSSPNSEKDIGIINSAQAVSIQCPDWTGHYPIRFGVRAIVGTIESTKPYNYGEEYVFGFVPTTDTSVVSGKQYYTENEDSGYMTPVLNPTGNPHSLEYCEEQLFILTQDTTVVSSKTYYEIDPGNKKAEIADLSDIESDFDPRENNFYEKTSINGCPTFYTFSAYAESDEATNGGSTPIAPQDVKANQVGTEGTIQVTWDNPWDDATGAEVSWADHDDALYSTSVPSTFNVSNIKQSKLNVTGLELGKVWYVWVRLYSISDDGAYIYSEYSAIKSVNLSSAPAIPNFEITPETVSNTDGDKGKFICSWDYTSTDGTDQKSAIIYEVTENNGIDVYTPFFTDIKEGQQSIEFKVSDILEKETWTLGSTHRLAVQVISSGGMASKYSTPASISLADPIDISVTSTLPNLIDMLNPETLTGASISIAADDARDIHDVQVTIPYTGTQYYGVYVTQTAGEVVNTIGNSFSTRDSGAEVENFYGGTYNLTTGVLTSAYNNAGSALGTPVEYNLDKLRFTVEAEDQNTFVANAYAFTVVASPQTEDITTYYELDNSTDYMYFKTSDEEINQSKTYYALTETGSNLAQSITVADNDVGHKVLRDLPLTVEVNNISEDESITVMISREKNFVAPMPDENEFVGYEGETVFLGTYGLNDAISIDMPRGEDYEYALSQKLDDEGEYVLSVIASDNFGQVSDPINIPFVVNWANQAVTPEAIVEIDNANRIAKIKLPQPTIPSGDPPHDFTEDSLYIYRLSGDIPKMIYSGAAFYDPNNPTTTTYVDPYPTIGSRGGYRIVLITKNGDYITPTTDPAWIDVDGHIDSKFQFIDFGGQHIDFIYNVNLDNNWDKNFTLTHYLGGSIQGDWLAGVERSSSVKGMTFDDIEPDTYDAFRDLAEYVGVCHVRTIEGSNYTANIKVSDSFGYNSLAHQHDINLDIQRCESADLDGMTLAEWEALNS